MNTHWRYGYKLHVRLRGKILNELSRKSIRVYITLYSTICDVSGSLLDDWWKMLETYVPHHNYRIVCELLNDGIYTNTAQYAKLIKANDLY